MAKVVLPGRPIINVALAGESVKAAIDATIVQAKGTTYITTNGVHNVAPFETAEVNVPIPSNYGEIIWDGITLTVR